MRKRCFFEITFDSELIGRIVIELFDDLVPKTAENFRALCTGERGRSKETGVLLHYKKTKIHKIVKGFMIQGGDVTNRGGKGGESIYGPVFDDELLTLKHDKPYLVTMANKGPNSNSSQFFITTAPAEHLDGKHVVFGAIIKGRGNVRKIQKLAVDSRYHPISPVVIVDCGELKEPNNDDEFLDPGVIPPPEVMDSRPNWLDRTASYTKFPKNLSKEPRRRIPWDID